MEAKREVAGGPEAVDAGAEAAGDAREDADENTGEGRGPEELYVWKNEGGAFLPGD